MSEGSIPEIGTNKKGPGLLKRRKKKQEETIGEEKTVLLDDTEEGTEYVKLLRGLINSEGSTNKTPQGGSEQPVGVVLEGTQHICFRRKANYST